MMERPIPQTDPSAAYSDARAEINEAIQRVLDAGSYILGPELKALESTFAAYLGAAAAIGVASGTDAIELALRACGVRPGDTVITVSMTASATAAAIRRCGALPAFVDVSDETLTMEPAALREAFFALARGGHDAPRAAAVVPVHLYGMPADMKSITEIAHEFGAAVVEDCAQAHGASIDGRRVGTFGDAAAFSFYPTKNLPAFGDAGMVVAADEALADRVRALRQYGWRQRYVSAVDGVNSRLDEIQAAVLRVMLRRLDERNGRRREIAASYTRSLQPRGIRCPVPPAECVHVFHQYVIRVEKREALRAELAQRGVATAVHYPVPVHRQPAFRDAPAVGSLAVTEAASRLVLSLPMYPELDANSAARVADAIESWLRP